MAHAPQSPAGETRANRSAPSDQFEDAGAKAVGVSMFCAPQQRFPCFFRLINRGTGTYPSCTAPTNFGRITGGYQAKEQADYQAKHQAGTPPVARKKAAVFLDFSSEKRARRFYIHFLPPFTGEVARPPVRAKRGRRMNSARRWGPTPARPPSVSRAAARATPPPRRGEEETSNKKGAPSERLSRFVEAADQRARVASRSSATMLVILIIGLTAGPAVSLYGSPTVSPVTAALWASEPLPP